MKTTTIAALFVASVLLTWGIVTAGNQACATESCASTLALTYSKDETEPATWFFW
jgi:hypothetical protein